jgi:hypothetical protein
MALVELEDVLHILDLVMPDVEIRRKGKTIRKRLKELPTEDIVRCKECMFWSTPNGLSDEHVCLMYSCKGVCYNYTSPNHYCAYGERK